MNQLSKSERVRRALETYGQKLSDRQIALIVGVSNRTVSKMRKQLEAEGSPAPTT